MSISKFTKVTQLSAALALALSAPASLLARSGGPWPPPRPERIGIAERLETRDQPGIPQPQGPPALRATPHGATSLRDDSSYRQSGRLLAAIGSMLARVADHRTGMDELPSRASYVIPPFWTETREDRDRSLRNLLDAVLAIVADAPIVELQQRIARSRDAIANIRARVAELRERRLAAPVNGVLPGVLTNTRDSLDRTIEDLHARIRDNEDAILHAKRDITLALQKADVQISAAQLDLLLDSVLGGDLVKLASAFQAARGIDERLAELLVQSNEDIKTARRYFAMHTALFAMILRAQDALIEKIDTNYLVKLVNIAEDIDRTREATRRLLSGINRPDQQRALEANAKAQELSNKAAHYYRDYLITQRRQLAEARERTRRDLEIADNTFQTVEASFQLHSLMEDARTSFEALKRLEAPGFDQVFKNEALRREFENLTQKLGT